MRTRSSRSKSAGASACSDYTFRQRFRVPAEAAFRWCIDFTPEDWKRLGEKGTRKVTWLTGRTVLLDDSYPAPKGSRVRKRRIVQIYPETRQWVSTHVSGPNLHSQFRYTIVEEGANASSILFEGRELRWRGSALRAAAQRRLSRELRAADSGLWRQFAAQMERDLGRA